MNVPPDTGNCIKFQLLVVLVLEVNVIQDHLQLIEEYSVDIGLWHGCRNKSLWLGSCRYWARNLIRGFLVPPEGSNMSHKFLSYGLQVMHVTCENLIYMQLLLIESPSSGPSRKHHSFLFPFNFKIGCKFFRQWTCLIYQNLQRQSRLGVWRP